MTTFLQDTFSTGTDQITSRAGETGATWTIPAGSTGFATLVDFQGAAGVDAAAPTLGGGAGHLRRLASGLPGTTSYDITVRLLPWYSSSAFSLVGAFISTDGSTHTGIAFGYDYATGAFRLDRVNTGTRTQLASYTAAVTGAVLVTVLLERRGNDYELFVDGVSRGAATDAVLSGVDGRIELYATSTAATSGTQVAWDEILGATAGAPPATPPTAGFTTSIDLKTVTVTSTAVAGTNPITSTLYDWGDGSADDAGPTHLYVGGTYTITQTVSDGTLTDDAASAVTTKTRYEFEVVRTDNAATATDTVDVNDA